MAKVTEVRVDVTYTKSLPNYENVKPSAGLSIQLEPGDNAKDVFAKAWDMCGAEIASQIALFQGQPKAGAKKGL
jgi:hypothetical protein